MATAYARAYHQIADVPIIFTDSLAARILTYNDSDLRQLQDVKASHPAYPAVTNRTRRLFVAARARFAEDVIAQATSRAVQQVVILGAGLDTFAYRNPPSGPQVFEVDEPVTQSWKRRQLAAAGIRCPSSVAFVGVDFETHDLAAELALSGFKRDAAALFVWMGVTMYLTMAAIEKTLAFIATQAPTTEVVLDFIEKPASRRGRSELDARARHVATLGEPWHGLVEPAAMAETLSALGLASVVERSAADLIATYTGEGNPLGADTLPRVLHAGRQRPRPGHPGDDMSVPQEPKAEANQPRHRRPKCR